MAFTLHIDRATRRALGVLSGSVTGHEFAEAMDALYHDPAWSPGFEVLWDFTAVRELLVDRQGVETIVAAARACRPRMGVGRTAIAIPNEMHQTIASLVVYKTRGEGRDRRIFDTRATADAWLNEARAAEGAGGADVTGHAR